MKNFKKQVLFVAFSIIASVLLADDSMLPTYVQFSSEGPDKYADGSVVLDNELYALVWIASDAEFSGFTANGGLVDETNNKLIFAAPLAKDGKCPTTFFVIQGENLKLTKTGSFKVYLLDTRVANSAGAKVLPEKTNLAKTGVNSWSDSGVNAVGENKELVAKALDASVAQKSALPLDVPNPKVTAINVIGSKVVISVKGVVPYLEYTLASGATPSNLKKNEEIPAVRGSEDGEIKIIVDDAKDQRFFKVIRK